MAKAVHNDVIDAALGVVRSNATRMVALAAEPADYAAANTGALANATMVAADFTIADGVVSGRRVSVAAKANVAVAAAGTANHVALLDPVTTRVLYVTTCPAQALPAGGTVSFAGWDIEIGDPA
jgi:hypothetical protein